MRRSIILIEAGAPDRMTFPRIQGGAWQEHSVLRSVSASAPNSGGATLASPPPKPAWRTRLGLVAQNLQAIARRRVGPCHRHNRCSALSHHGQRPGDGQDGEQGQDRPWKASGHHGGCRDRSRTSDCGGGRRIPWQAHLAKFRGDDDPCSGLHQCRGATIVVGEIPSLRNRASFGPNTPNCISSFSSSTARIRLH